MKTIADFSVRSRVRDEFNLRLAELRGLAARPPVDADVRFAELEARFDALARENHGRLLESDFAWTQEERDAAAWLRHSTGELAALGQRIWEALVRDYPGHPRMRHMMARTFLHLGNAYKWDGVVNDRAAREFRKMHAMMRSAITAGFHDRPIAVTHGGNEVECSIEALYFRALLLARFSSGTFGFKQLEILDAWMFLWKPVLTGTAVMPPGGAFRADLDSNQGLRPGVRTDDGPCLYLPVVPIQKAYAAIVAEFHAGRIVPAEGITSRFRVEEHVAVLELARRGLQGIAAAPAGRAERQRMDLDAELLVGLGEIVRRGFPAGESLPRATPALATRDGKRATTHPFDNAFDRIFDPGRRTVVVADASATGFGIEGDARDLGTVAIGELVALRFDTAAALEICKVVRHVPVPGSTRNFVGLQRISSSARLVNLQWPGAPTSREAQVSAPFVPGSDASGRLDGWLVSEREFASLSSLDVDARGRRYTVRFSRIRDRGAGWVLAGFEVGTTAKAA